MSGAERKCEVCGASLAGRTARALTCSERCSDERQRRRAAARERLARIEAHDREWERRHTSRGRGFDAGAGRTSPVPWEGDGA